VVINEKVLIKGRIPSIDEVKGFFKDEEENCSNDTDNSCCSSTDQATDSCCS